MRIASWNVNSIKARLDHVRSYLQDNDLDVLMLQELKGLDFPADVFEQLGYHCDAVTQKSYNGVALISKHPASIIHRALPGDEADEQARYIEADINGIRLINIYLPNGNPVGTEKYSYKLAWMVRLKNHLQELREQRIPFAIGGDFNIIPDDRDCHDPNVWRDDALFRLESLQKFRALINLGLTDAFRVFHDDDDSYSFWDYQAGAWPKNNGIRIDHFLLSPVITDRLRACTIDKAPRGLDRPSDHTPVIVEIAA